MSLAAAVAVWCVLPAITVWPVWLLLDWPEWLRLPLYLAFCLCHGAIGARDARG